MTTDLASDAGLRRAISHGAFLNFAYFGIEFAAALTIRSVSLLADIADFFEDAAVNFLILAALGWSVTRRAKVGILLSAALLAPALTSSGCFGRNSTPGGRAARHHRRRRARRQSVLRLALALGALSPPCGQPHQGRLLSLGRNGALANIAIIAAGGVTLFLPSVWPDVIVGFGIAVMNLDAAREVPTAAREEHRLAEAQS